MYESIRKFPTTTTRREISLETLTSELLRTWSELKCQDENSGFGDEVIDIAACATSQGGKGRASRRNEVIKPGVDYQPGEKKKKGNGTTNSKADVHESLPSRRADDRMARDYCNFAGNIAVETALERSLLSSIVNTVNADSPRAARSSRVRNYNTCECKLHFTSSARWKFSNVDEQLARHHLVAGSHDEQLATGQNTIPKSKWSKMANL